MQPRTKILLATLLIGLPAFTLLSPHTPTGQTFWPEVQGDEPEGGQVVFLITYGGLSALAMGFGLGYLAFGLHWTRQAFPVWTVPAHLAISFMSASFWIHDNLHAVNGENVTGLILLEYLFHLPMMAGGIVLAVAATRATLQQRPRAKGSGSLA